MEQQEEENQIKTMKQQEEETQIKKRRQSSSVSSSFPHDLISEILLRLPLKTVGRFRCVSKLWSSVTTDRYFINSFVTRPQSKSPRLLLCFRRANKVFAFSIPQDHPKEAYSVSSQPVDRLHMTTYHKNGVFSPRKSVQGLICFPRRAKTLIWNPTTRHISTIHKPEKSWKDRTVFLGYDPIGCKHKLVSMPWDKTSDECRVLTLGSDQESWRMVKTNHNHRPSTNYISYECINGVLYYHACIGEDENVLMSFDVRSEKFHAIKPQWNNSFGLLTRYKGKLACATVSYPDSCLIVWTLKDPEKHYWSPINFPGAPLHPYAPRLKTNFRLTGITDAGEFVYVPYEFRQSFYVMYYDPKRKSIHVVEFKGIADDEFRLKHGLGNRRLSTIFTVPNHIESLVSL
ncbi:unnamed protein product [Microthlaspi erraticum]|uniref:F-box domain-containing protein n=1 Tax=Microthlaspi erraticum TaxID=1685480 RepID=A0A6D2K5G7_9BRAS|nr:unnamed protein product [Microthlaspi erraticum]CAA7048431.1 unnamed protein product [Microthlaspi erraticum]